MSGLWALCSTSVFAVSRHSQMNCTLAISHSPYLSRSRVGDSITRLRTGIQSATQLVSQYLTVSKLTDSNKKLVDLIDSMLIVDPEKRFTIDQCLSHPWLSQTMPGVNDSTGGLVGGLAGLEVNRRAPARERTLLSSLNTVEVTAQLQVGKNKTPVKVFSKNKGRVTNVPKESGPASQRVPDEFMELGGKGDQSLYGDDNASVYPAGDTVVAKKAGKPNGR